LKNALTGDFLIDRNSTYFPYLIQFIKEGKLPQSPFNIDQIETEAEFFGVTDLISELNNKFEILEPFPPVNGAFVLLHTLDANPYCKGDIAMELVFKSYGKVRVLSTNIIDGIIIPHLNEYEVNYKVLNREIYFCYRPFEDGINEYARPLRNNLVYCILRKWETQWILRLNYHDIYTDRYKISQVFFLPDNNIIVQ